MENSAFYILRILSILFAMNATVLFLVLRQCHKASAMPSIASYIIRKQVGKLGKSVSSRPSLVIT